MNRCAQNLRWCLASLMAMNCITIERRVDAHHSFAMFDFTKAITARATVTEFQWTNPHVILSFVVDGTEGGSPDSWWAELTSPGNLTRIGWSKRAFKAGDRIDITVHPLRDGTHGGAFAKATLTATGQVWTSDLRAQEKPGLGLGDGGTADSVDSNSGPSLRRGCSASIAERHGHGGAEAPAVTLLLVCGAAARGMNRGRRR